ncbi:hypothetical protein RFI_27348, partial [Reticulomyxa filosa]
KKLKQDPKEWAIKFASGNHVTAATLQTFAIVLRDESASFATLFIRELGLMHLCRHARNSNDAAFIRELLQQGSHSCHCGQGSSSSSSSSFLSIITLFFFPNKKKKLDINDCKTRENIMKLLVMFVGDEGEEVWIAFEKVFKGKKKKKKRHEFTIIIIINNK